MPARVLCQPLHMGANHVTETAHLPGLRHQPGAPACRQATNLEVGTCVATRNAVVRTLLLRLAGDDESRLVVTVTT